MEGVGVGSEFDQNTMYKILKELKTIKNNNFLFSFKNEYKVFLENMWRR